MKALDPIEVGSDTILRLKGTLRGNIPINPLSDTLAITGGIGRNRGESVRVVTVDGEEQIELWGFRYKRTLETLGTFEGGTLCQTTGGSGLGRFNVVQLNGDWGQMGIFETSLTLMNERSADEIQVRHQGDVRLAYPAESVNMMPK